ncbi:hypothetical protein BUE67_13320, partial [Corynebacterium diphtheriae]
MLLVVEKGTEQKFLDLFDKHELDSAVIGEVTDTDRFVGKKLMEATLEAITFDELVGIQDMGAAGLTSSSSEMAAKGGSGLVLYLDQVPTREPGISPYEMMLSETQERMLLVVEKGTEQKFLDLFDKHELDSAVIGEV